MTRKEFPLSEITLQEKHEAEGLDLLSISTAGFAMYPSAFAIVALRDYLPEINLWNRLEVAWRRIKLRRSVEKKLGKKLVIEDTAIEMMVEEVRRFKWLEAERAGRDIWVEHNPQDPEAPAFQQWFARHFGAWYLSIRPSSPRRAPQMP